MKEDYLLYSLTAKKLYQKVANLPIIDYHCHLSIKDIIENKPFTNISQLWLSADHYKWRLMRMHGIDEQYITGDASDYDKYVKYMQMLVYAIDSPIYYWSKLELSKYFGVEDDLIEKNIMDIYNQANHAILDGKLCPQKILQLSGVEKVCIVEDATTFDYESYKKVKELGLKTNITPIFRVDKLLLLSESQIKLRAPQIIESFKKAGCNSADFGIEYIDDNDDETINKFSYLLAECYKNKFVVQLHFSPMRNNNKPMLERLGIDKGFDSISEKPYLSALKTIFDKVGEVGKTIIFNLNPSDNAKIVTFAGNYAGGGIKGKVQMGAAWWFNDNKEGINQYFKALSGMSLLSASVGMLTDSRSIISYARHDYFRRLLCDYVGNISEKGEFTTDFETLKKIVCDVSYNNIKSFLN